MPHLDSLRLRAAGRRAHPLVAALLLATACGPSGAQDQAPPRAAAEAPAAEGVSTGDGVRSGAGAGGEPAASAPLRGSTDEFGVTIGSGPFAGTHRIDGEMNCFAQDGIWGGNHTVERSTGLTEVLVMLTGVPAGGGTTEDVNLGLVFGQLDDTGSGSGTLGIGGASGGGSGRAVVERAPSAAPGYEAVVRIEGRTHYGAPIEAELRCRTVG